MFFFLNLEDISAISAPRKSDSAVGSKGEKIAITKTLKTKPIFIAA